MPRLLVVDDHHLIFDGLHRHLPTDWSLVWAPDLAQARQRMSLESFDRCVLDVSLGRSSGLDALSEFVSCAPTYLLTMHDSPILARRARIGGASGYFLKDDSLVSLLQALLAPPSMDFLTSPSVPALQDEVGISSGYSALSGREQQVFVLLAEGLGYKEVAHRLGISPKTVNVHKDALMKKLDIHNPTELVLLALRLGLTRG